MKKTIVLFLVLLSSVATASGGFQFGGSSSSSGGIASINSDTTSAQVIAAGTSGTDVAVSTSSGTTTVNVPSASATARGVVNTSTQTIAGVKTFSSYIQGKSSYALNSTTGSFYGDGISATGQAQGRTATLGIFSFGPGFVGHTDEAEKSTLNNATGGFGVSGNGAGFFVSAATAIGNTRSWTNVAGFNQAGDFILGGGYDGGSSAALATNATGPFMHVYSCAGTPTGVPATSVTGKVPIVVDTTNNKLYGYYGGSWHSLSP